MNPSHRIMKILIAHAHSEQQSFNTALRGQAVKIPTEAGHEIQVSDLYAMHRNPVASKADFTQPSQPDYYVYALEQRKSVEAGTLADDIRAEIEKVQWCDLLILNFPIFWFSAPAILKGWIDLLWFHGAGTVCGLPCSPPFSSGTPANVVGLSRTVVTSRSN